MAEHTPGPWSVEEIDDGHEIRMGSAVDGRSHGVEEFIRYDHGLFYDEDNSEVENQQFEVAEANARLIAASPDLLRELKAAREFMVRALADLVDVPGFDPTMHARIEAIDAAISKAEQGGR